MFHLRYNLEIQLSFKTLDDDTKKEETIVNIKINVQLNANRKGLMKNQALLTKKSHVPLGSSILIIKRIFDQLRFATPCLTDCEFYTRCVVNWSNSRNTW